MNTDVRQMSCEEKILNIIKFMLGCFIAERFHVTHPATWGHIVRELRRAGVNVDYEGHMQVMEVI